MTADAKSKYSGAVIGQALGDALGFPVEGCGELECASYVERCLRAGGTDFIGRGRFPFGQYTDDTQLMRELLSSARDRRGFDPADYAARIAALFVEGRVVGRGRATERAALRIAAGVPWHAAGEPAPAAGNGSAMRAGAVGLLCPRGGAELARLAHEQGRITHSDPRCSAGAVAIAAAVARGVRGEAVVAVPFCEELAELAVQFDVSVAEALAALPRWLALAPEQAVVPIAALASDPGVPPWRGISPFVTSSVIWSLYAFLRSHDDYVGALRIAIAVGGDVDTTAAMTGAISGAHLGLAAIPHELASRLTDQGHFGYDELVVLALAIGDIARE